MKFKTLKRVSSIDSKFDEFASIGENGEIFTHQHPTWLGDGATIEDFQKNCGDTNIDWGSYKVVEIEYFEIKNSSTVGADIRNKLTPPLNLVALLRIYFNETSDRAFDDNTRDKLLPFIKKEMENSEKCIKYIANLL